MKNLAVLFVIVLASVVATAGAEELAGTRPGAAGEPLLMHGAFFLLDVIPYAGCMGQKMKDINLG